MRPSIVFDPIAASPTGDLSPCFSLARRVLERTKKYLPQAVLMCCALLAGHTARAEVLDFDDLVMNVSGVLNVPTPYKGFLWGTVGDTDLFAWGDSSYAAANSYGNSYNSPSGENQASNYAGPVLGRLASGNAFDFNGANFSTFTIYDALQSDSATLLTLEGFNGATLVESLTVSLGIGYNWVQADFLGITSLRLSGSNSVVQPHQTRWMMDDFTFNATSTGVPEPATLLLALCGLGLIGRCRRAISRG
ncbi:MAG: hypothetical protein CAPSK01_004196 [Candidatus Accumulibacter vicinus]|uniref:Ice-binding protein C-terminal domain-containing protein n=1 Tax=Candidatus Accumulibacter vicinus TaxID=2954382 RepID=A0A084XVM3_9PROT|nr:MAG: hypothetical protein CAPSK01_004196 [Candidatus Accumulibacter vicinus]